MWMVKIERNIILNSNLKIIVPYRKFDQADAENVTEVDLNLV
jgi:hypothetical protein